MNGQIVIPPETMNAYVDCIFARIVGNSMEPTLMDGDIIMLDPYATTPADGVIVSVFFKGRGAMVARYRKGEKRALLVKDNPEWAKVSFPMIPGSVAVQGTVRCVIERRKGAAYPVITRIPITRGPVNTDKLSLDEINQRQRRANAQYVMNHKQLIGGAQ